FPNPLVIESGDTQEPLLKALGQQLRNSTSSPINVLYVTTGSCTLIDDMFNKRNIAQNATLSYLPTPGEDSTWDISHPSPPCTVDQAGGLPIAIAISATFVSSCTQNAPPAGTGTINGPIQGYAFIVPKASSQRVITAEEGYFTFGFGQGGDIQPWVDPNYYF